MNRARGLRAYLRCVATLRAIDHNRLGHVFAWLLIWRKRLLRLRRIGERYARYSGCVPTQLPSPLHSMRLWRSAPIAVSLQSSARRRLIDLVVEAGSIGAPVTLAHLSKEERIEACPLRAHRATASLRHTAFASFLSNGTLSSERRMFCSIQAIKSRNGSTTRLCDRRLPKSCGTPPRTPSPAVHFRQLGDFESMSDTDLVCEERHPQSKAASSVSRILRCDVCGRLTKTGRDARNIVGQHRQGAKAPTAPVLPHKDARPGEADSQSTETLERLHPRVLRSRTGTSLRVAISGCAESPRSSYDFILAVIDGS